MVVSLLRQAIELAQAGHKQDAGTILKKIVKDDPENEMAWYWLSYCVVQTEQKIFCLQKVLKINPNNTDAQKDLKSYYEIQQSNSERISQNIFAPPNTTRQQTANQTSPKVKRISPLVLVAIVSISSLLCISVALTATGNGTRNRDKSASTNNTPALTVTPTIDSSVKAIMDGAGLSEKDAEKAFEVIKSVGFKRVENLTRYMEIDTLKGYLASLGYTSAYLVVFDGNDISVIGRSDNSLRFYDLNAGGILDKITNYVLTSSEAHDFERITEDYVTKILKAPSTAKFPDYLWEDDEWNVARDHDLVYVTSYVDAENSFGASLRNEFVAQYRYSTGELLYLELAKESVYGTFQEK